MKRQALIVLLLVAGTVAITALPSGANPCPVVSSSGGREHNSAVVEAQCGGQSAPEAPSTRSLTMDERWAIHCQGIGSLGAWREGDVVVSYPTQDLTVDDVVAEGLDPTGAYTYWSHQCNSADGVGGFTDLVVYKTAPPVPAGDGSPSFDCGSPTEPPGVPWVFGLGDDQINWSSPKPCVW